MRALDIDAAQTLVEHAIASCTCTRCRGECARGPARCTCSCVCGALGHIDAMSARLDELDDAQRAQHENRSLLGAALWYAEHGLRVFPLMPLTKRPWPRSHGCHDATSDVELIRRWWTAAPTSNVAIATGHVVDVIDVDGFDANRELLRRFGGKWERVMSGVVGSVSTPRAGGRHLYVPTMGHGNRARMGKRNGLDYRGLGGYVVAPPSTTDTRDGQVSGVYRWTRALSV